MEDERARVAAEEVAARAANITYFVMKIIR
jgi:hypothetical protein